MLYYRLLGKTIVLTAHNVNVGKRDSHDTLLNRLTLRIQWRLADHIFVHTERMKRELLDEVGACEQAVSVVPYGINNAVPNTDLTPAEAKRRLGIRDRHQAILKLLDRLPASERKMLPEVQPTVAALYERATDLARTLHALDTSMNAEELAQIDERLASLAKEPDDPERARRLSLLERQRQAIVDIQGRRNQVASHLESCVLAMQNVRFDLLRLRSAGVAAVLGDLTQATQQAKALSRDVDNAIAAAGEIREAMRP